MKFIILLGMLFNSSEVFAQDLLSNTESVRVIFAVTAGATSPAADRSGFIPDTEIAYSHYQLEERELPIPARSGDTIELVLNATFGELVISYPSCGTKDPKANLALYTPPARVSITPVSSEAGKEIYRFKVKHKVTCPNVIFFLGSVSSNDNGEAVTFSLRDR